MPFQNRYVITENIARFEALLREGHLDSTQIQTVEFLLARVRVELAGYDTAYVRLAVAGRAASVVAALASLATVLA